MDKVKVISTTKANYSVFGRCSKHSAEKPLKPRNVKTDGEIFAQKVSPAGESTLLVSFFNFFYYVGLVPFKTELVRKTNSYCVRTNILQQVQFASLILCLVMCFLFWFMIHESDHYSSNYGLEIYGILSHNSNASSTTKDASFDTNFTDFKFEKEITLMAHALIVYSSSFYVFMQGVFFVLALALRQVGKEFHTKLNNLNGVADIQQGILLFRELQGTSNLIRKLFGNQMLAFYISAVSYYAETPYILLGNRGESERAIVIYFLINGLNWVLAAEFHHNIFNSILHWISIHTDSDSLNCDMRFRLLSISNEMLANPIALSCRCFAVTYQHLGSGIFFVLALALWQVGKEFRTKLNKLNEVADIEQGILLFRELKGTSNLIRKLYGNPMLAFYIASISYYAQTPYILLGNRGDSERGVVIYFLINGLNWVVAAEFHYNVSY
ncbi:unnamed protein product [Orchesella dallaii]|uniref:Gustatory receptor n=1 Tax=Orchesella dallaii TaxID=48710 RepID=A0ABP1PLH9_9HEXA